MSRVSILFRVAWFLSRQRTAAARWRAVSVGVAAGVLALSVGLTISLTSATAAREAVAARRLPVVASDAGSSRLRMLEYGPVVEGRQFPMFWVQAVGAGDVVPPGLDVLPEPGTVVVSPALLALGESKVEASLGLPLARRDGLPLTIGERGLASPAEFVAYATPPRERGLRSAQAVSVAAFGATAPESPIGLGYPPDTAASVLYGGLLLLVVPALYLLWISLGSASPVRDQRLDLLHAQGVGRRALRLLTFLESLLIAAPGVAAGVVVWWLVVMNLPGVAAAGLPFFRGDLRVGLPWLVATAVLGLPLIGALGVLQADRRAHLGRRSRTSVTRAPNWLRLLPVYASLVALVGVHFARYPFSTRLWYGGLFLAVTSLPLALPVFVQWSGRLTAKTRTAEGWLAGKRLVHHSARLSRPALTIGTFVLVGTVGTAIAARTFTPTLDGSDPPVVYLGWSSPEPADLATLRAALPHHAVLVVKENDDGSRVGLVAGSCADVLPIASARRCDSAAEIPPGAADAVAGATARAPISGTLSIAPPGTRQDPRDGVLVVGPATASGAEVYRQVLPAAHRALGPSNLAGAAFPQFSERPRRAGAGVAVSAVLLLLSALQLLGERSIGLSPENSSLSHLGAAPSFLRRVTFIQIAVPSAAAACFGGVTGIAFAVVGTDIAKPETAIVWPLLIGEVGVVIAFSIGVAALVARMATGRSGTATGAPHRVRPRK